MTFGSRRLSWVVSEPPWPPAWPRNGRRTLRTGPTLNVRTHPTSATGTAWDPTSWHATQRAAWEAVRKVATRLEHAFEPCPGSRGTRRDQNPATYGSFRAVVSIAVPASSSTAVESHVPPTS